MKTDYHFRREDRSMYSDDNKYIPLSEASTIAGYSIDHLRRLIQKGKMRGERIGRNYVTTRSAVQEYLASSPKPGPKSRESK